jgi:hypothetical protein
LISPVSVVAPVLHNHLFLNAVLIRWLNRQSLGIFEQCSVLCDITEHWTVKEFHSVAGLHVVGEVLAVGDETFLINKCVHVRYGLRLKQQFSSEHVLNSGKPADCTPLGELHVLI